MLAEDQAADDAEYDDESLPDENAQIEYLRRQHHDKVATDADMTLRKLEELKQHVSCNQISHDASIDFITSRLYKHRSSESSKNLSEGDILSRCGLKMRTGASRWRREGER